MRLDAPVTFGPFRLDAANERLWQGSQVVALRPKPFAVLKRLVEHHGQLVTKQQLLDAVWPSTFVGDAVLKDSIRQLREALDDDAASPRYIETAHRRGYRFIGQLTAAEAPERVPAFARFPAPSFGAASPASARWPEPSFGQASPPPAIDLPPGSLVADDVHGRDAELAKMRQSLARALRGERQVVFVTGEAGIAKTTVVNALLAAAAGVDTIRIARGQCLEQYGAGEAYLPVLDAFSRLGRGSGGLRIIEVLRQHAPGRLEEGLTAVAEALVLVHEIGEQCPAAELHRLQGELLIMQADGGSAPLAAGAWTRFDKDVLPLVADAEACFERALALARSQQARSWELKVATSLGHLLHRQGKREKARRIVRVAYDWFAEGLDTADLKAARAALSGF